MKKILGGVLVLLSIILVGSLKAETLDELGSRTITSTIKSVQVPTYEISLTWDAFEYDYNLDGKGGYLWSGNPKVSIVNNSNVLVAASFDWTPTISGTGMNMMHMNAVCTEITDEYDLSILEEGTVEFYTDSTCTSAGEEYVSGQTYYYFVESAESWYDSLTSGTTYYNQYINANSQGTANGLLNGKDFIIKGDKLVSNAGDVIWAPKYAPNTGVAFNFSLADTERSRDNLTVGDEIGTLTVTIDDVE